MAKNKEDYTGIIVLIIFLFICLLIVMAYTGFNPLCNYDTNSTQYIDRCLRH